MKNLNHLLISILIILPLWASGSAFRPTFKADKPKVCLGNDVTSEVITFTNTTDESLWTGTITYTWKFVNPTTKDTLTKVGYGPYTLTLTEGDWAVIISAIDEKMPKKNEGSSQQTIYLGRSTSIDMKHDYFGCNNAIVELDGGPGFEKYFWFKGADTVGQSRKVQVSSGQGKYNLTAISYAGCVSKDSANITREICTSVLEEQSGNIFVIAPNPATDIIHVRGAMVNNTGELKLLILDIMGKEIMVENMSSMNNFDKTLDLSILPRGMYNVQYMVNGRKVKSDRIILK